MFAVTVIFTMRPGQIDAFLRLACAQATNSLRLEPGCHQFDIWTDPARPDQVYLYETYADAAAFDAHLASDHFKRFAEQTEPMVFDKQVATWAKQESTDE
ncbi:MAG: putative quinol monooxygenase [Pseudomonadota bacterium]